ncbi:alpha/beta hydrolase [Acinetobacter puyangensis]|uniref:Pimeloyl-ACP methyl ester carboxylesterase n=1 Tax=Acinetobacter puyangensis TaxID=1096779 RepID=A0A240ED26_9GAMM|nr:alpha/beta fold hydrolase [Acinetobacter puyangensis]SNX45805.1 Pimeloyl-ACP methyl ester carboxylesterase [Acinetobacter puyangensis]
MDKHIVLIHGAWQGSWSFDLIRPLLIERGWQVHALDLPGNGHHPDPTVEVSLRSYSQYVADYIHDLGEKVFLLGHSGGGITISQVAEMIPDRIHALIYLVGMMLPNGMTFLELKQLCEARFPGQSFDGISPYLKFSEAGQISEVTEEGVIKIFLQDYPVLEAARLARNFTVQTETGRDLRLRLSPEHYGRVPRTYIEALQDQSLNIKMQRLMQELSPGAEIYTVDTGHVPQVIAPGQVVEMIERTEQKYHSKRVSFVT